MALMRIQRTQLDSPLMQAFEEPDFPLMQPRVGVGPKRNLYARGFDRFSPQSKNSLYPMDDEQKSNLFRRGLLELGVQVLQPNGGNLGAALAKGLLAGNNSLQQGARDYTQDAYQNDMMRRKLAGESDGTPSGYREFELMAKAAGLDPATDDYKKAARVALGMDGRASSAGFSQVKFTDSDGRERIGVINGKTGKIDLPDGTSFNPSTGAYSTPSQGPSQNDMEADIALANDMVKAGIPDAQIDAFLKSRGNRAHLAPLQPSTSVFVGRRKEEEAAAVAEAEQRAKLAYAPEFSRIDAQTAGAKARAEARAQQDITVDKRSFAANDALDLISRAKQLLPLATGSRVGQAYDAATGFFGASNQGAQANAQLAAIAGQLVAKMPRMEGPQSDRDVQMYKEMAGDIANPAIPVQTRLATLRTIEALQQKYANQRKPAASSNDDPLGIL